MKALKIFARVKQGSRIFYVLVRGRQAYEIQGNIFSVYKITRKSWPLLRLKILAPVVPSKVIAVGLNYRDHAKELKMTVRQDPIIFLKPPSAIIGPGENVCYPRLSGEVHYEAELGIIIEKKAKNISPDRAADYILGYTCANDVTARDLQKKDGQWTRAKSFDTFCPCGPYIVQGIDPGNLKIQLKVNGKIRQNSSTRQMIFKAPRLVSYISQIMTLFAGDLILTGTPPGVGPVEKGDRVEVVIEKIGCLANRIK